jgi:hypothetical protein
MPVISVAASVDEVDAGAVSPRATKDSAHTTTKKTIPECLNITWLPAFIGEKNVCSYTCTARAEYAAEGYRVLEMKRGEKN